MSFETLNKSNVLVTGASGFIGNHVCNKLIEIGAHVYGISRKIQASHDTIHWIKGDLSNHDFVMKLFDKVRPDYVIHLASHVLGAREVEYVFSTFNDNLVTTLNILTAVDTYNCKRLVLAGSFEEGQASSGFVVPSSPYAAAKIAATNYARMFHKLYNTSVCTASIFMVYGPGQVDLTKLIPYTILKTSKGESAELTSGVRMIDWIYVDDVAEGLLCMLIAEGIEGKNIDLGSGKSVSIKEIIDLTVSLIDTSIVPKYGATKDRPMEQERNANITDTFEKLHWKTKVSLKEGLKRTIAYYTN